MIGPFLKMLFGQEEMITARPTFSFTKDGMMNYFKYSLSEFIASHNHDKVYGLLFICAVVIVANLFKNLFLYIAKYILHPLRNDIVCAIRQKTYDKLLNLPIGYFSEERKGDLLSRITNDVNAVELSVIALMELLFSAPVTVLFYFFILLYISPSLFIFLMVLLPIAGLMIGRVSKSLKRTTKLNQEKLGDVLSVVEETIGGLRIIKAFGAENKRSEFFNRLNDHIRKLNNQIAARRELASPMSEFLGITVLSVIIWFGGKLALHQPPEIEPSLFIMFISLFYFLINPLKSLSQLFFNLHQGQAALTRIQEILNTPNTIVNSANAIVKQDFQHSIEFKNVSFSFGQKQILQNINFTIQKGDTVAIVGASGAGKSTLVDLIPRFHDVTEGEICMDGINIKQIELASLRKLMGIVSQEPILFNESILENIALGDEEPNEDKAMNVSKAANASTFISQKEHQYHENVGDRGVKLSGGEKQRITIARALYKNPPILILDEATSSLDTVSERVVQDAIDVLMKDRTSIVIAHRLATVRHADKIIVLEQGRIVESGTHDSLLQLGGKYKQLVEMQMLV
jgi:ABC-type multidrug transport system, ATPase and permease components